MIVYLALAQGFEEIEAITVVDVMRRAGIDIKMFSATGNKTVAGAHNISVVADHLFEDIDFDSAGMLILPGGMPGTTNLKEHTGLASIISDFAKKEKWLAAICAAPSVFGGLNILNGRKATSYPGFEDMLNGATVLTDEVVVDGRIVTSRGPGTAIAFALKLVELVKGSEASQRISEGMLY